MKDILLLIQTELKVNKTQFNKFGGYHYRNHEDQCNAIKPLLQKHGVVLTLSDHIVEIADQMVLESTCTLWATTEDKVIAKTHGYSGIDQNRKGMTTEMAFGSASSYARKYAFNAMFLCDDNKDSDATHKFDKSETTKSPEESEDGEWL
jgi:hypothetical protein